MPQNIISTPQPTGKADVCVQGRSCGLACIDRDKECLKNLSRRSRQVAKAIAALIRDQSGVKTDRAGRTVSQDPKREAGLKKLLGEMQTASQNWMKARRHAIAVCKKSGKGSPACKEATAAAGRARDNMNDVNRHAMTIYKALNNMTEAGSTKRVNASKLRHTEEEVERGKIEKKATQFIQKEIEKAAETYHAERARAQTLPLDQRQAAEQAAFDKYKVGLDEAYAKLYAKFPESIRVNPNSYYVSQELAEAAYEMMPKNIRSTLNKAGSLPQGTEGVVGLKHGEKDFDENGLYTGGRGDVVDQQRSKKWDGVDRGVVSAELYLRNEGRSGISMAENDLRTFQLEHLNDLSSHKETAETYGNLFPAGGKENQAKGAKDAEDYVNSTLEGKSVEQVNAQADAGASKKGKAEQQAKSWVEAQTVPEREAAVREVLINDPAAQAKFIKKVKETAKFNENNDNFNPDIKKLAKASDSEIMSAYENAPEGSEFHFIAAHSNLKTNDGSRATYKAAGMASYGQDKKSGFRGTRTTKVIEGRMVAAAYAVGTNENRAELAAKNKSQMKIVNDNTVKEKKMTGELYNNPMRQFLNGDNESGTNFSWFPR